MLEKMTTSFHAARILDLCDARFEAGQLFHGLPGPLTDSSHLKMYGWEMRFLFGKPFPNIRGYSLVLLGIYVKNVSS